LKVGFGVVTLTKTRNLGMTQNRFGVLQ